MPSPDTAGKTPENRSNMTARWPPGTAQSKNCRMHRSIVWLFTIVKCGVHDRSSCCNAKANSSQSVQEPSGHTVLTQLRRRKIRFDIKAVLLMNVTRVSQDPRMDRDSAVSDFRITSEEEDADVPAIEKKLVN